MIGIAFKRSSRQWIKRARRTIYHGMNNFESILRVGRERIGIISCDKWKGRVLDDLLLQRALIRGGFRAEIISWQDKKVDLRKYSGIVFASMWGYQNYLEDFLGWLKEIDELGIRIFNSLELVRNNYDKECQIELLKKNGIPHVKTEVIKRGTKNFEKILRTKKFPYVVKPSISGGGEGAVLVRDREGLVAARDELEKINNSMALLVQPFIKDISEGEISLVVLNGGVSHAVLRRPGVFREGGDFKVQLVSLQEISQEILLLAQKIIKERDYRGALYMRIDLVVSNGAPKIMELELFEPQLFYYLLPRKKRKLALEMMVEGVRRGLH